VTALARIQPIQRSAADCLRGLAARFEDAPLHAMMTYVAERLDAGKLPDARLAMGAIYRDHYKRIPVDFRQELDLIADKLGASKGPRSRSKAAESSGRSRSARTESQGGEIPRTSPWQLEETPRAASLFLPGEGRALPQAIKTPHPVSVFVATPVLVALPVSKSAWFILGALGVGLGVAHWSDQ